MGWTIETLEKEYRAAAAKQADAQLRLDTAHAEYTAAGHAARAADEKVASLREELVSRRSERALPGVG